MPYVITILPRAVADIRASVAWRSLQAPPGGARLYAGLLGKIGTLANSPDRCPLADEALDLGLDLRELL